ncbi:MAG TPA: DUF3293 domain-containing protein [Trebonia sp.]|nr:DUF3293 domain-containing protein [Trebonia sp.]
MAGAAQPGAWEAYITTEVRIELPGGAVRVFPGPPLQASGAYPDPEGRPVTVINGGAPLMAELARRGLHWWPAASGDPTWTHVEQGVAVPGLSESDALALGAALRQEVIVVLTPASRRVIDCATGRRSVTGWITISEAELGQDELEATLEEDLDHLVSEHGPDPRTWDVPVLAESRWGGEEPEGEGTPVAGEFLVLLRDRYVIYETEGVEWGWDYIEAPDRESAIGAFRAAVGEG